MAVGAVLQGFVAGGTALYLSQKGKEAAERCSSDTWMIAALKINHVLLLTAESFFAAGLALGHLGSIARMVYIALPLSLIGRKVSALSVDKMAQCDKIYQIAIVASSILCISLGNPWFGLACLSTLKANGLTPAGQTLCALSAFIGYGTEVFAGQGLAAQVAEISTLIMAIKLLADKPADLCLKEEEPFIPSSRDSSPEPRNPYVSKEPVMGTIVHEGPLGYTPSN